MFKDKLLETNTQTCEVLHKQTKKCFQTIMESMVYNFTNSVVFWTVADFGEDANLFSSKSQTILMILR